MNALTVLLLLLAVPFSLLYVALNVVVVRLLLAAVRFVREALHDAEAGRARLSSESGPSRFDPVAAERGDAGSRSG
jgi:hypothetical protein